MKTTYKVIYLVATLAIAYGVWMLLTPPNEGGLVPVLIGAGLIMLATYKFLTDAPGK